VRNSSSGRQNVWSFSFLRAIESILLSVLSALEAEMVFIRNLVGGLLAEMEDNIDHDRFKRLLHYSRRLAAFKNRAKLVGLV
jgi:magnesium transporter